MSRAPSALSPLSSTRAPWLLRVVAALLTTFGTACVGAPAEPAPVATTGAIVDPTPEPDEPAVVSIASSAGYCTGSLIAPQLVLTAKHCVVPERAAGPIAPGGVSVGIGPGTFDRESTYRVREILTTPGPLSISVGDPVRGATGTDIALLVLRTPVEDVEPLAIRRDGYDELVGMTARAIGYGTTASGQFGIKNRQDTTIRELTEHLVGAVDTICQGDSGGPLLVTENGERAIVGVASFGVFATFGSTGGCPADADYWNRVDEQLELIDYAFLRAGTCPPEPRDETCNSLDDDCDGTIDEGCLALGETCERDDQCAYGPMPELARASSDPTSVSCVELSPGERRCALPCDLSATDVCGSLPRPMGLASLPLRGFSCHVGEEPLFGSCTGYCAPAVRGTGANGAACVTDAECASMHCLTTGETGICADACVADRGSCTLGEVCSASTGCGFCSAPDARVERGFGEVCTDASQCADLCAPTASSGTTSVCTRACASDARCPTGFRCADGFCASGPRGGALAPCTTSSDCAGSAACIGEEGATFCAVQCSGDAGCPAGLSCDTSVSPGICRSDYLPVGAACSVDDDCAQGLCLDGACALACDPRFGCPPGRTCRRTASGVAACLAPEATPPATSSGCAATPTRDGGGPAGLALAALAWVVARRRVRR